MATSLENGAGAVPPNKEQQRQLILRAIHDQLGIAGTPTHYQLFGLADYESDPHVIKIAAQATLNLLADKRSEPGTKELIAHATGVARLLLDADAKKTYDETLRAKAAVPAATQSTKAAVQEVITPAENQPSPATNVSFLQEKWRELTAAAAITITTVAVGAGWYASSGGKKTDNDIAVKAPERPGDAPPVTTDLPPTVQTPPARTAVSRTRASTSTSPSPLHTSSNVTEPLESANDEIIEETSSAYPPSAYPSESYKPVTLATPPTAETAAETVPSVAPTPAVSTTAGAPTSTKEVNASATTRPPMSQERRDALKLIQQEALKLEGLLDADNKVVKGKVTPDVIRRIIEKKNLPAIANSPDHRRAHDQATFVLAQLIEDLETLKISLEDIRRGDFSDEEESTCMTLAEKIAAKKGDYVYALALLHELRDRKVLDDAASTLEQANILMKAPRTKDAAETARIVRQTLETASNVRQDNPSLYKELLESARSRVNTDPFTWDAERELADGDEKAAVKKISLLEKHPLHDIASRAHEIFTAGNAADAMACYQLAQECIKKAEASSNGRKAGLLKIGLMLARQATAVKNASPSVTASAEMLLGKYEKASKPSTVAQTTVKPEKTEIKPIANGVIQKNAPTNGPLPHNKPFDLMPLVDLSRDTAMGTASANEKTGSVIIETPDKKTSLIKLPMHADISAGDLSFTISVEITPLSDGKAIMFHLPIGKGISMQFDTNPESGGFSGLMGVDGKAVHEDPRRHKGKLLKKGQPCVLTIFAQTRGAVGSVQSAHNGEMIYNNPTFELDSAVLKSSVMKQGDFLIGGDNRAFEIRKITITPHAGSITPKAAQGEKVTATRVSGK